MNRAGQALITQFNTVGARANECRRTTRLFEPEGQIINALPESANAIFGNNKSAASHFRRQKISQRTQSIFHERIQPRLQLANAIRNLDFRFDDDLRSSAW